MISPVGEVDFLLLSVNEAPIAVASTDCTIMCCVATVEPTHFNQCPRNLIFTKFYEYLRSKIDKELLLQFLVKGKSAKRCDLYTRSKTILSITRHQALVSSALAKYLQKDISAEDRLLNVEVFQQCVARALLGTPINNSEEPCSSTSSDDELSFNDVFDCAATEQDACYCPQHQTTRFYSPIMCLPIQK